MAKIDTKKLLPNASKTHTVSEESVQKVSIIASKLVDVNTILKGSLALDEIRKKKERKAKEKKKRNLKEKMRESIKGTVKGVGKSLKKKAGGMMDWLNRLIFGVVMLGLFKLMPVIKPLLPLLGTAFDGLVSIVGWLANAASTLIHWGYKLYDGLRGFVKNIFGEGGLKVFDNLMSVLNNFMNVALMAVMSLLKFKWLRNFAKNITKRIGKLIMKIPGVKQAIRSVGIGAKRLIGRTGRTLLKTVGKKGLKQTITGGLKTVAKKGAAKVGGFALKIFGKAAKVVAPALKAATPAVKGFASKIPILGPVIVALVSLLSGESVGQALFKGIGAALGGALGTFIPIPIIGTLLGETIGMFVGDLLYYTIMEKNPAKAFDMLKKTITGIFSFLIKIPILGKLIEMVMKGGNILWNFGKWVIFDALGWVIAKIGGALKLLTMWLKDSMDRFIKNFPVFNLPLMKFGIGPVNVNINWILGKFFGTIPWFQQWITEDGLMHFPDFSMFVPVLGLPFLMGHLGKSLFPGSFFESWPSGISAPANAVGKAFTKRKEKVKEKVEEHKKEIEERKKEAKEKLIKRLGGKVGGNNGNKEGGRGRLKDRPEVQALLSDNKVDSGAGSLQNYAGYESGAPQTAMIPLPPAILPVDQGGGDSLEGGGSSGGAEDPFETLYVGGLV